MARGALPRDLQHTQDASRSHGRSLSHCFTREGSKLVSPDPAIRLHPRPCGGPRGPPGAWSSHTPSPSALSSPRRMPSGTSSSLLTHTFMMIPPPSALRPTRKATRRSRAIAKRCFRTRREIRVPASVSRRQVLPSCRAGTGHQEARVSGVPPKGPPGRPSDESGHS